MELDPEQLAIACLPLLRYASAKAAFDSAKADQIEAAQKSDPEMLREVTKAAHEIVMARSAEMLAALKEREG